MDTIDPKCNFPSDLETYPNVGNGDESLLRQPIRTSCTGFREAKKAYENGTDEVRHLLMHECSIIYECNACRNMFRSLANFICHKRSYCKVTAKEKCNFFSDNNNSGVFIKTVERPEVWPNKSRSTDSSPIPNVKPSTRDLSKVIERLRRVEVSPRCYDSKNEVTEPKAADAIIELERVSTTDQAVYQTFKLQNDCESIKTELDEVNNLLTNDKTLLGPDGKVINNQTSLSNTIRFLSNEMNVSTKDKGDSSKTFCKICKTHFQTEKTFKMHVQKKHNSSTYVFQCPTCSLTFLQPAAVIRHLANEHKKPLRRIRKMRDTILKKRIQIGDVQIKGPSREVKRLILGDKNEFDASYISNQQNGKSTSSCMYCKKSFERRAALATHLTSCLMKKDSLKNIEETSKSNTFKDNQVRQAKKHNQIPNQHKETIDQNEKLENKVKLVTEVKIKQEPTEDLNSSNSSSTINQMFEDLEKNTFGNGLQTVSLEKLEIIVNKNVKESQSKSNAKIEENAGKKLKRFRVIPASKQLTCRCKICNKQFNALSNLRRHISMFHYRSRRFGCNLCDYRAFRRYDIVNHLTFVHKMTGERESMSVEYVTVHEIKYSKDDVEGDIVVVNEDINVSEQIKPEENSKDSKEILEQDNVLKTYEKKDKRKNILLQTNQVQEQNLETITANVSKDIIPHVKVVRKKLKKAFVQQVESKKRPIRNRIKTVNKDFVYDLLSLKEEPKETSRNFLKRRNTMFVEQNKITCIQHTPPAVKIKPYRLRAEPLIPANKNDIKGFAANVCRNVIHEALAAPATLPELPSERPQMRSRIISSSRSECNAVPIIETSEIEAARLKSTFFDDSFLEKFAKKTNPSFKMKPLLALQHSPLNSILQKFDATLQNKSYNAENNSFIKPFEKTTDSPPPSYTVCSLQSLNEMEVTPNGKHILEHSSPPSTPKKRITLMQRLAENRAKRRDSILRTALEN